MSMRMKMEANLSSRLPALQQRPFNTTLTSVVLFFTMPMSVCARMHIRAVKLKRLAEGKSASVYKTIPCCAPCQVPCISEMSTFHRGSLVSSLEHHVLFMQTVGFEMGLKKTNVT